MITISCLPIAGVENPYQSLMMKGLQSSSDLTVAHGETGKLFGILLTALRQRPDYIHFDWIHQYYLRRETWMTYLFYPLFILQVLVAKYIFRIKLVWTLHNVMPHDSKNSGPNIWARRFFARQTSWIRVFSDSTINRAVKILKINRDKFVVIPEGSYVGYYPDIVNKNQAKKHLNLSMEKRILLFFGSLRAYKGIEELIFAFANQSPQDWQLIVAGMCRDHNYLKKLEDLDPSGNTVIYGELIPVNNVQYYMNSADLVILPFRHVENSGSAILAMGFSKAILAPKIGVLPTRLKNQMDLLYEGNVSDCLAMLSEYSTEELNTFGQKNYAFLKQYKWEDFAFAFN